MLPSPILKTTIPEIDKEREYIHKCKHRKLQMLSSVNLYCQVTMASNLIIDTNCHKNDARYVWVSAKPAILYFNTEVHSLLKTWGNDLSRQQLAHHIHRKKKGKLWKRERQENNAHHTTKACPVRIFHYSHSVPIFWPDIGFCVLIIHINMNGDWSLFLAIKNTAFKFFCFLNVCPINSTWHLGFPINKIRVSVAGKNWKRVGLLYFSNTSLSLTWI